MNGNFDFGQVSPLKYFLTIGLVLGVLFAFITPDSENEVDTFLSFIQWQLQTLLPLILLILIQPLVNQSSWFKKTSPWFLLGITGLIVSTFFTPIALFLDNLFAQDEKSNIGISTALFEEWVGVAAPITLAWLAINAPWVLGYRLEHQLSAKKETSKDVGAEELQSFYSLLPEEIGIDIIFIKSELHYLNVVTSKGEALVLSSLKQATAVLGEKLGIQTHRSYWVSFNHIKKFTKQGRQGEIELTSGELIPVSRSQLKKIEKSLSL